MKNFTLLKFLPAVLLCLLFSGNSLSQTTVNSETFDTGFGIWTAGNSNVSRVTTDSYQGAQSVRFRGGTTGLTLTSPTTGVNTSGYDKVDVKFFLKRENGNTGDQMTLEYRASTLAGWTVVRTFTNNDLQTNDVYHAFHVTLFATNFTFGALSQFRFVATLNNNTEYHYLDFVSIIGTTYNTITSGPGGITNGLDLWLRADKLDGVGAVADNAVVNKWEDVGKGNDASVIDATNATITNRPSYRNNATNNINFNPVVYFNNNPATSVNDYTGLTNKAELNGTSGFSTYEQFIVVMNDNPTTFNSTTPSIDLFCAQGGTNNPWDNDGTGFGFGRFSVRFDNEVISYCHGSTSNSGTGIAANLRGYGINHNGTGINYSTVGILSSRNNTATSPTGNQLYLNANRIDNQEVGVPQFTNFTNRRYWLGRSQIWNGTFGGRIAEVITYSNRKNDATERRRIESYLALKYGITLGINGTSMDYQDSNGNVVWNQAANAGYNYDIAGIFRDDSSQHSQKQSQSINPTDVMTIGLTDIYTTNTANTNTFTTNRSYLVWGANGGTMMNSGVNLNIDLGPTTITTITEVVNRKYKIVETGGDVGTTRVSIPTASFLSGLPALGATDAYVMVVATNAAFTTGLETVFMTTTGGNQTCLYDFDGTKFFTFGVAHRATNPLHITLDGVDDFVKIDNVSEISSAFTIMTWIRPNGANTLNNERTILAKKPNATSGYQLVLQTNNRVRIEWTVAGTTYSAITNTVLPNLIWHNIAVTYGANTINMYIDGVLDRTATINVAPVATSSMFSIGGQYVDKLTINNLFKGDIDELRMWNKVLTLSEIRYIMNQEILQNGTGTRGTILPTTVTKNEITTLNWNNLFVYYSMNSYIGTHLDDDSQNLNRGSLVIPDKISINTQTAPMPYISNANGLWSATGSWVNGAIQDIANSPSIVNSAITVDWNIVRSTHNINSTGNKTLLGLFVNSNTLSASNDSKLEVSHYLKLDGKIDLVGMSQLIQTINSDLDPTSAGSLERDQQGQKNVNNYNYWSSPVGTMNNTTNNNSYTVAGVMKDGTTATPQNITWTSNSYNGSPTSPITLASYWIFKFQNMSAQYANWSAVGPNGTLNAAQGYTLKGSGSPAANQNYTFVGKPNNGIITTTVAANNTNLSGNPYASALDAHAFIDANVSSITGTLYFWEHFASNNTHNLHAYQGGYAQLTKVGSTAAVTYPGLSGLGSSTKAPGRYIPVSQGFFIVGSGAGGTVTFNNNQRAFFKENNALSNTLFKNSANSSMLSVDHFNDNSEDALGTPEAFKKVRLGFDDRNGYHREILMGFMNEHATSGIDQGYDAVHLDDQPNDMYFMNDGKKLNISGEGFFNVETRYPVSVKTDGAGTVTFKLDETENFDGTVGFYIYDGLTNLYHDISNGNFSIDLPQGNIDNRFKLTFKQVNALGNDQFGLNDGILIAYTSANNTISIKNRLTDATVENVTLYNILGQSVGSWKITNQDQQNIQLPVNNLSTGTYIVKVKTDKGEMSRKTIIN